MAQPLSPLSLYCSLPSAGEENLQAMRAFEELATLSDPNWTTDDPTMLGEEKL